jgi:hypothetical protein
MTEQMLELARANQANAGITNVHWLKADFEAFDVIGDPAMDEATRDIEGSQTPNSPGRPSSAHTQRA